MSTGTEDAIDWLSLADLAFLRKLCLRFTKQRVGSRGGRWRKLENGLDGSLCHSWLLYRSLFDSISVDHVIGEVPDAVRLV